MSSSHIWVAMGTRGTRVRPVSPAVSNCKIKKLKEIKTMSITIIQKRLLIRFVRGAIAGAVSAMLLVLPASIGQWREIIIWLNALAIAGTVGFITGALQAADLYFRNRKDASQKSPAE